MKMSCGELTGDLKTNR